MANANFITQFEYRLNNLTGSETQAELLALRSTADKYVDDLDSASIASLDAAINAYADALTNSSTIKELSTVGNADAEIKSSSEGVTEVISIGNQVASGSSGELFNVDPGLGLRVLVTALTPQSANETNIEIKFGDRVVYTGDIEDGAVAPTRLTLMQGYPGTSTNEYLGSKIINQVKGYQGEILTVRKTSGTTGANIYLSYIITD